jgi:hypothetical protein
MPASSSALTSGPSLKIQPVGLLPVPRRSLPGYARLPTGLSGQTAVAIRVLTVADISPRAKRGSEAFLGVREPLGSMRPVKKKLPILTGQCKHGALT